MDLYAGLKINESESGDYHLLEPISSLTGQGQFVLCEDGSGNKFVCPEDFWLHHAPKPEATAPVHADSTSQENIDFFLSLFRGRDSLCARRYYSSYIDVLAQENLIGSRFKKEDEPEQMCVELSV